MLRKPQGFLAFVQTFGARLDLVHPSGRNVVAALRDAAAEVWTISPPVTGEGGVPLGAGKTKRYSVQGWEQWLTQEGQQLAGIRATPMATTLLDLPAFAPLAEQYTDYLTDGVAIRNAIRAVLDAHRNGGGQLRQEEITAAQRTNLAAFIEARLEA